MRRALLMKDLRLHGVLWFLYGFVLLGSGWLAQYPRFVYGVPLLLGRYGAPLLAALLAVAYFASEAGTGTEEFLFSFPVRRRTVWLLRATPVAVCGAATGVLSAAVIQRALTTLPTLTHGWNYGPKHYALLQATLVWLPVLVAASVTVAALCASLCRSRRASWLSFTVTALVMACAYAALSSFSGTWEFSRSSFPVDLPSLDWLVVAELLLIALLAMLAACRTFSRTAPLEISLRRKRAAGAAAKSVAVAVALLAPFHHWADRTPPATGSDCTVVALSKDGRRALLSGGAVKLGRRFDTRLWFVDLTRPKIRFLARGESSAPRQTRADTLLFRRPRFLRWPRFRSVATVDLRTGAVKRIPLPALRRLAALHPKLSAPLQVNPKTFDLLFVGSWGRAGSERGLWYLDRSGRRLHRLLELRQTEVVSTMWHPRGVGAYAVVFSPDNASVSPHGGTWWIPIPTAVVGAPKRRSLKPVRLLAHDYGLYRLYLSMLSADGEWLFLPHGITDGDTDLVALTVRAYDGRTKWERPVPPADTVQASWSPTGARLAVVSLPEEGSGLVSVCDPATRTVQRVATIQPPFDNPHSEVSWSGTGRRLLVEFSTTTVIPESAREPFSWRKRYRVQYAAFEVDLSTRRVRTAVRTKWEGTSSVWDELRHPGRIRFHHPPWFVGYDYQDKLLFLPDGGHKLVRIDPETSHRETVLAW